MDNLLNLIGMARKAGRLELGEEPVGAAARAHDARIILLASDTAENSVRRANHFAEIAKISAIELPFTKEELGMCVGRASCAILAITDTGFAAALTKKLKERYPEKYDEVADTLDVKAAKAHRRLREKIQHEKKLQRGKLKPWAAPNAKQVSDKKSSTKPKKKGTKPLGEGVE